MKKYILLILTILSYLGAHSQSLYQVRWGCIDSLTLVNHYPGYDFYVWDYGDGRDTTVSDTTAIPLVYDTTGTYIISLSLGINGGIDTTLYDTVQGIKGIYMDVVEDSVHCTEPFLTPTGEVYTVGGEYEYVTTDEKCSYRHLVILHQKSKYYEITRTFCQNDSVVIGDTVIHTPGDYHIQVSSSDGCDSTVDLHLSYPATHKIVRVNRCQGETFVLRDSLVFTTSTVHTDSMKNRCGGDSIVQFVINFHPKYYTFLDTVRLCEGVPYIFYGDTILTDGYHDTIFRSKYGCDSTIAFFLVHIPSTSFHTDTVVDGYSFAWLGDTCWHSGFYSKKVVNSVGCEDFHTLKLLLDHHYDIHKSDTICGHEYLYEGHRFIDLIHDTLLIFPYTTSTGKYDSIIYLHLNVLPSYDITDTIITCDKQYAIWDTVFTESGTYMRHFQTVNGCDSIRRIVLNLQTSFLSIEKFGRDCWTTSFYWPTMGRWYPTFPYADIIMERFTDIYGCDSIYIADLSGSGSSHMIHICRGDTLVLNGRIITEPGEYVDTLINCCGSDSLVSYKVNFHQDFHFFKTVHICEGSFYNFNGRMISAAGDHRDTLFTVNGCDSIYHLHLIVHPHFHHIDTVVTCQAGPYHWRNKYIRTSGIYYDSLSTPWGCDSIYELRITMNSPKQSTIRASICQGDVYWLRKDRGFTQTGTYYDTLLTSEGCDSIVQLVLNVNPEIVTVINENVCEGHPFHYKNRIFSHSGTYFDTLTSQAGCDSLVRINLTVHPEWHDILEDTVCTNVVYHWRNRSITQSGIYFDSLTNIYGCDSIYELRLVVHNLPRTQLTATICQGDSFLFAGQQRTLAGTYQQVLQTQYGCDSIVELILNVVHPVTVNITRNICDGDFYPFGGQNLTVPGIYSDTLLSSHGCDSILRLILQVFPLNQITEVPFSVCEGESITVGTNTFTAPGVYYDTLLSSRGCDSVIKYVVTLHPSYHFYDTARICEGDHYMFRGRSLSFPGVYYDSLTSVNGCDSIYQLDLTVNLTYHFVESDTLCSENPYPWRGKTLTESGVYYDSLTTAYGCDSVYELRLGLFRVYKSTRNVALCPGKSYQYRDMHFTAPCVYVDSLTSRYGCDSIITLIITMDYDHHAYDTARICQNEYYIFHGQRLSGAGDYQYVARTVTNGCDSIDHLHLIVNPYYISTERVTLCSNERYLWRGRYLSESGVYYDSLSTSFGCDSVFELNLTINPPILTEIYHEICQGSSFRCNGKDYSRQGTYYDTLLARSGCDSILKLTVSVNPAYLTSDTAQICYGESYTFRGRQCTGSGVYRDTLKTIHGCDSISELVLTVLNTFHSIEYENVCTNSSFLWHDKYLTRSGTYFDSLRSVNGCDSVHELRLTIRPIPLVETSHTICEGESYYYRGRLLSAQGVYYDTLKTIHGCDSILQLTLTVAPTYLHSDTAHFCSGETYTFRGRTLRNPGIYYDSLQTSGSGCDSVYRLVLISYPTYLFTDSVTLCSLGSYAWRGMNFSSSGVYYDSLTTVTGCDSVYRLVLRLNHSYLIERHVTLCPGDSFFIGSRNISSQGTYYDSLLTSHGCDSVFRYVVTVSSHFTTTESATICQGDVYNFRGRPLTYAGTYMDTVPTVGSNCDSIFVLNLSVNPTYYFFDSDTVCSNQPYLWRGRYLTQSGIYYDSLQTVDLCDSVFAFSLSIYPEHLVEYPVNICSGQSYQLRNRTITEQGIYLDTLQSIHGCDSIVKYILTVRPTYLHFDTVSICLGDVYDFHGRYVNRDGIYYDTLQTVDGCDSICLLRLNVLPVYHFIARDTLCTNGTYTWRNRDLSVSGIYYDSLLSRNGCDSVYELRLTIFNPKVTIIHQEICHGTTFFFRGQHLSQPGTYRDTLTRSSGGCDSIVELVLSVAAGYFFESSATICQGDSFNFHGRFVRFQGTYYDTLHTARSGCDSIYKLNLTVHKTIRLTFNERACANEVYYFNGTPIQQPGTYIDTFKTADGCDSILTLNIAFFDPSFAVVSDTICPYQSYTTPTGKILSATGIYYDTLINRLGCDSILEIRLYVRQNTMVFDTATVIKGHTYYYRTKPYTSAGIYYDTARSIHGCDTFFRLVLTYEPYMVAYLDTVFCDNHPFHFRGRVYTSTTTDTILLPAYNNFVTDTLLIIRTTVIPHSETYVTDSTCDGNPYFFGGIMRTKTGVYVDSLLKTNGCDSIVFLSLIVYDRMDSVGHVTICETDSYSWHGRTFTQQGVYYDTLVNPRNHCNMYYELHLDFVQETKLVIANLDNKTSACQNDSVYYITPIYTGTPPDRYSIIYDGVIISHDNDIIDAPYVTNTIEVPIPLDNVGRLMRPDRYNVTLSLGNTYCDGSPYDVMYELLIEYPASVLNQHFNDVVSVFNATRNGGYDFTAFKWFVNGILAQGYTESNLYMTTLAPGDMVHAELRRNNENYFIPTCPLEIGDLGAEPQTTPVSISAYFFIRGSSNAVLTSSEAGDYWLYDLKGALIRTGEVLSDIDTEVPLPPISGCYFLSVRTKTSYQTFKLIVQ